MFRLAIQAAGPGSPPVRILKMAGNILTQPVKFLRTLFSSNPARNSVILLIMQTIHSAMRMDIRRGLFGWKLKIRNSEKVPSYIPAGQDILYR
jgi:hypothetical protein